MVNIKKYLIAGLAVLALCLPFGGVPVRADDVYEKKIEIEIKAKNPSTGAYDLPADVIHIGDMIRATVTMIGFPDLESASPSLHFNPDVVQACDANGITFTDEGIVNSGFYDLTGNRTWGSFFTGTNCPYLRNDTGVIRVLFTDFPKDLLGIGADKKPQIMYSVYFKAVGIGDADIRRTKMSDGPDDKYYDSGAYYNGEEAYVTYETVVWGNPILGEFTSNYYYDPGTTFSKTNVQVVPELKIIESGEEVFATFDASVCAEDVNLVLTVYDGDKLYKMDVRKGKDGMLTTKKLKLPANLSRCTVKAFVWKDFSTAEAMLLPREIAWK